MELGLKIRLKGDDAAKIEGYRPDLLTELKSLSAGKEEGRDLVTDYQNLVMMLEEFPFQNSLDDPIIPQSRGKVKAAEALKMLKICQKFKKALLNFLKPANLRSATLW